jgi:hypothetical protein
MTDMSKAELGDTVHLNWNDGFADGIVNQVHQDGSVDVFRPYIHVNDFSVAGREEGSIAVYCYIGFEQIKNANPERLKVIKKAGPIR